MPMGLLGTSNIAVRMLCPFCQTENREDREKCYACDRDLSMLRLIVNKARHHYNVALEHAERGRITEAIDELHNALDLDRRLVSAHVVLGTLHAKRGEHDKAREAWDEALALQPELQKAHNYLGRVEQLQAAYPAFKRLRLISFVLLAFALGLLSLLLHSWHDKPSARILQDAQRFYRAGNFREALDRLEQVRASSELDSVAAASAVALATAIRADMSQRIERIQNLKLLEEYPTALTAIAELEKQGPDTATSAALEAVRRDINFYYRNQIKKLYDQYVDGEVTYANLESKVQQFLGIYPELPEKEELQSYLQRAKETEAERAMEGMRAAFQEKHDVRAALSAFEKTSSLYPGTEAVRKGRAELADQILSWKFEQLQELMDKKQYAEARQLLTEISDMAEEFRDVVNVNGPVELWLRVLADEERVDLFRDAEALVRKGDPLDAQEAILQLSLEEDLTTAELNLIASYQTRLDERLASGRLRKLREREGKYLALEVSDREASETLASYEGLLAQVPDLPREDHARVLAYAAASAIKLGDQRRAARLIEDLKNENSSAGLVSTLQKLLKKKK